MSTEMSSSLPGCDGSGVRFWPGRVARRAWNINVLLVDDDAADTAIILDVLKRHSMVSAAHAASSPHAALSQLAAGQLSPDLILLDIHMPGLNGFGFLERLRAMQGMADVPAVFLTTSRLGSDVLEAKRTSASLYVVKPDTYAELRARLDKVIRRALSGDWSR